MTVDVKGDTYMKWQLENLFSTIEDFNKALQEVFQYVEEVKQYEGKLNDKESFKKYFLLQKEFEVKASKVYLYAHLSSDLNKKDVEKANLVSNCMILFNNYSEAISFEEPELIQLGKERVFELLNECPEIEEFRFKFVKLFHVASHILSKDIEKVISQLSPAASTGSNTYSMLAVADGTQEEVTLTNGEKQLVTQGNWQTLIEQLHNPIDQKNVFESIFKPYEQRKNTFAAIYESIHKSNNAFRKVRGFNSILESYLFNNNIPTKVYETLVEVAGNCNDSLKKYIKLRKEYLGLDEYHTYDRFQSLAKSTKKYSYEDAKQLFFESIEKYPDAFKQNAYDALKSGYVDVYEQSGKRTGAYSSGVANIHPYILLNYSDSLEDVFTVAHEAGHSIHTLFASQTQPVMLQDYTIFVAEIASTFNEHNLLDYLMTSKELSKDEKIVLLQKSIDSIISTFYRQTLFAEFELIASRKVENEEPINHVVLSQIMIDLYNKYYGIDITKEQVKQYVWAYIPHLFYTPFYVYQYATSFAASFKIYQSVKNNEPSAFENYINLLKSGGSKYPIEQAKEAGVDFTKRETFEAVTNRMDELVNQLEQLLK